MTARRTLDHLLERQLNAPAWDILDAAANGFRTLVDLRGKLAELYLARTLHMLKKKRVIIDFHQSDRDDEPDFVVTYKGRPFRVECKNVRSGPSHLYRLGPHQGCYKVEIQKTRSGIDRSTGGPTRGYAVTRFDILAACLFNQTGRWTYLFAASLDLERRPTAPDLLAVFQPVPQQANPIWRDDLIAVLDDVRKRRVTPPAIPVKPADA